MKDVSAAAAARVWQAVRAAGILGMPRVRIVPAPQRGPDAVELVVEDQREPGDEVAEFRGIRFYLGTQTAEAIGAAELHLDHGELVFKQVRT